MRGSIVCALALLGVLAFAPASQASPLIPGTGISTVAPDDGVTQVRHWRRHHRWGYRHHRRCWRHRWC
jgi:hypothetical protein